MGPVLAPDIDRARFKVDFNRGWEQKYYVRTSSFVPTRPDRAFRCTLPSSSTWLSHSVSFIRIPMIRSLWVTRAHVVARRSGMRDSSRKRPRLPEPDARQLEELEEARRRIALKQIDLDAARGRFDAALFESYPEPPEEGGPRQLKERLIGYGKELDSGIAAGSAVDGAATILRAVLEEHGVVVPERPAASSPPKKKKK